MAKSSPIIGRIPAEIHLTAQGLGLIVETYSEEVAGHGPTGRVAWSVSKLNTRGDWTDAVRLRAGTDSSHEYARASLRAALEEIGAEIAASAEPAPERYVAMWNTPGCLPEMEPAEFDTPQEGWAFLREEIERAWDEDPEDAAGDWIAAHTAIHAQDSTEPGSFVAGRYAYSVAVSA